MFAEPRPASGCATAASVAARPLAAPTRWADGVAGSAAMVIATIGSTSFDGAQEGVLNSLRSRRCSTTWISDAGPRPTLATIGSTEHDLHGGDDRAVVAIFYCRGRRDAVGRREARALSHVLARLRPQLHPDRPRLPRRPLLQPRSSTRSRPSSPTSCPTPRRPDDGPLRHRRTRHRLQAISANAVWYVQVAALVLGHAAGSRSPTTGPSRCSATHASPPAPSTGCSP